MQVRGSLYKKEIAGASIHEHVFGEESYDEESDMYSKTCKTCGHTQQYKKMWIKDRSLFKEKTVQSFQ